MSFNIVLLSPHSISKPEVHPDPLELFDDAQPLLLRPMGPFDKKMDGER
jgi:hypothetical protein